jgi:hypothetical protein
MPRSGREPECADAREAAVEPLTLNPKFLQGLILKVRALMARGVYVADEDGTFSDDPDEPQLRAESVDLTDDEVIAEIDDLEPDQQAELVALFWIGRGDLEPDEWDEAMRLALERRREGSTAIYLLSHPHLAEHWDEGLDKLYDGSDLVETGEY